MRSLTPSFTRLAMLIGIAIAILVGVAVGDEPPKVNLKVNFDSTDEFTESCGTTGTATVSALTAAQRAAVLAKMQADFDRALGENMVNVTAGTGGDHEMILQGGRAPGDLEGTEWGDAGKPGMPGIIHEGEFTNAGLSGTELTNAISETISHEFGHKLGLGHNWDEPNTLMTAGGKVSVDERKVGTRQFNADDTRRMQRRPKATRSGEQKDSIAPTDLVHDVGQTLLPPENQPDDQHLDAALILLALPPQAEIGYISTTGEFIFQADQENFEAPTYISFLYSAGTDFAVRTASGQIHTLSDGSGSYTLGRPNPDNPDVFLNAVVDIPTEEGPAIFSLQTIFDVPQTGGFRMAMPCVADLDGSGDVAFSDLLILLASWGPCP